MGKSQSIYLQILQFVLDFSMSIDLNMLQCLIHIIICNKNHLIAYLWQCIFKSNLDSIKQKMSCNNSFVYI